MDFSRRSIEKEIIDLRPLTSEENRSAFRLISLVNRILGGTQVVLHHLQKFSVNWSSGQTIRILDLGTGISDIPEAILHWAKSRGFRVHVTALDLFFEPLKSGRKTPGLSRVQASCFQPPFADKTFDYVIASLFFHHLEDKEILSALKISSTLSKRGIIINDLERSPLSFAGFWFLTLFASDPIFRHDGLLSIRKGFSKQEMMKWISISGLSNVKVCSHFAGRLAMAGEK